MSMALSDQVGARFAKMREIKGVFTTNELAAKEKVSACTAQKLLRDAVGLGLVEFAGRIPVVNIAGLRNFVPSYRMKGKS
jgi:hypothetical protein